MLSLPHDLIWAQLIPISQTCPAFKMFSKASKATPMILASETASKSTKGFTQPISTRYSTCSDHAVRGPRSLRWWKIWGFWCWFCCIMWKTIEILHGVGLSLQTRWFGQDGWNFPWIAGWVISYTQLGLHFGLNVPLSKLLLWVASHSPSFKESPILAIAHSVIKAHSSNKTTRPPSKNWMLHPPKNRRRSSAFGTVLEIFWSSNRLPQSYRSWTGLNEQIYIWISMSMSICVHIYITHMYSFFLTTT